MDELTLWKAVLADLELDVSKSNYTMWLRPTQLVAVNPVDNDRQIVTIGCRTPYQKNQVEARYYGQIKTSLDRITGKQNELVFQLHSLASAVLGPVGPLFEFEQVNDPSNKSEYEEAVERVKLRRDYIFDTFAVSSTNEMAHAAASAVARTPGGAYHLLFLYGGVGVGKTHLMSAIGHDILHQKPNTEMLLCSGEEFMNELVNAIQTKRTTQFKTKYRRVGVLLVDDIQFIAGKDAVQEEFFHTFNAIVQNQGQIVLTSDKPPGDMVLLEDRLRSRFEGGLTIDIQQPNLELRTAILNIKAKARGVTLPMDIAQLVATHITSTRGLEGLLAQLVTRQHIRQEPITLDLVGELLGNTFEKERSHKYIPAHEVVEVVARHFMLKPSQLKGKRRTKDLVTARHLAMFILRIDLDTPLKEVGKVFGGRDHTTVMHAVDKVRALMTSSEQWRRDAQDIHKLLLG